MSAIPAEKSSTADGRKRVLLDTNIWSYVVESGAQGDLIRLARDSSFSIQIAPGVLYESLRLKDPVLRAKRVRLMTNSRFQRLMPEAYSESMEILREIERVRPDWLREHPDLSSFTRLKNDWTRKTGGFWVRCERWPETEARYVATLEGDEMEAARSQADRARREMIDAGWKSIPPMDKAIAGFKAPIPGWRGDMVEAWRVDSLDSTTSALPQAGHPYRDWIDPLIDVDYVLFSSAEWNEFWLYLADKRHLPRQWLRWAHSFAQRFRKVTSGSPGDTQLTTYFVETDVVISADRALLDILEACRPFAPCPLPEGKLIDPRAAVVAQILTKF